MWSTAIIFFLPDLSQYDIHLNDELEVMEEYPYLRAKFSSENAEGEHNIS